MNHRQLIKSLDLDLRRELTVKSNLIAGIHVLGHVTCMALLIWPIIARVPFWKLVMLPLGIVTIFLFTLLHETIHRNAFVQNWLNQLVARICGFLILVPATWFRQFHLEHHRETQNPDKDPELASPRPATLRQFLWHITGLPLWASLCGSLFNSAAGKMETYIPQSSRRDVRIEAIISLGLYGVLAGVSFYYQNPVLLFIWVIPVLLGQPFLRLYLLAEHAMCPHSDNMLENSRTTHTNWLVRKLSWNMPYHVEHHAYPGVPFYQLPKLYELIKPNHHITADGYLGFYRVFISHLLAGPSKN